MVDLLRDRLSSAADKKKQAVQEGKDVVGRTKPHAKKAASVSKQASKRATPHAKKAASLGKRAGKRVVKESRHAADEFEHTEEQHTEEQPLIGLSWGGQRAGEPGADHPVPDVSATFGQDEQSSEDSVPELDLTFNSEVKDDDWWL